MMGWGASIRFTLAIPLSLDYDETVLEPLLDTFLSTGRTPLTRYSGIHLNRYPRPAFQDERSTRA